jgi:hypothetical protein
MSQALLDYRSVHHTLAKFTYLDFTTNHRRSHFARVSLVKGHGERLSRQRGLIDINFRTIDTAISGNGRSTAEQDGITGHENASVNHLPLAVTLARGRRLQRRLERRHGIASLGRFVETNGRIRKLNQQENAHVEPILNAGLDNNGNPNPVRKQGQTES